MYNDIIKNDFLDNLIDTNDISKESYKRYFNIAENFETIYDQDLCIFSTARIIDMYKTMSISSLNTLYMINWFFERYTTWCIRAGMVPDGQNHFKETKKRQVLISCVNVFKANSEIITRDELISDLEALPNICDRFLPLAIFDGILSPDMHELAYLSADNFKDKKVYLANGRVLDVDNTLRNYALLSADTYYEHPFDKKEEIFEDRIAHNFIFGDKRVIKVRTRCTNEDNYYRRTRLTLGRIKKAIKKECYTTDRLRKSGIIEYIRNNYSIRENENEGLREFIDRNIKQIEYIYGHIPVYNFIRIYGKLITGEEE